MAQVFTQGARNLTEALPRVLTAGGQPVSYTHVGFSVLALAVTVLFYIVFRQPSFLKPQGDIGIVTSRFPILGAVNFYAKRDTFWRKTWGNPESAGFKSKAARFNLRDISVVGLSGPQHAKTFFNDRHLSLSGGYRRLFSGVPAEVSNVPDGMDPDKASTNFIVQLKSVITPQRLNTLTPGMVTDTLNGLQRLPGWNSGKGQFDGFDFASPLIFAISIRSIGPSELATQSDVVDEMSKHYWRFEKHNDFRTVMYPEYPSKGAKEKSESAKLLSGILYKALVEREASGEIHDDAVDLLKSRGMNHEEVIRFVVSGLFAAIINSTSMAMWVLYFTGAEPAMRQRVKDDLAKTFEKAGAEYGAGWDNLSTQEKLSNIPLEYWEGGFVFIEQCLREAQRLLVDGTLLRYLPKGSLAKAKASGRAGPLIDGQQVREGEFLALWTGSIHFNSHLYNSPHVFDPTRFERGEGSKDGEFVGWGAGLHPCTGMRFAKLEIIVFVVTMCAFVEWESVNPETGEVFTPETLPRPQLHSAERRPNAPLHIRFTRRE